MDTSSAGTEKSEMGTMWSLQGGKGLSNRHCSKVFFWLLLTGRAEKVLITVHWTLKHRMGKHDKKNCQQSWKSHQLAHMVYWVEKQKMGRTQLQCICTKGVGKRMRSSLDYSKHAVIAIVPGSLFFFVTYQHL